MSNEKPVRILSIDGGGIRGIIPALVLSRLEAIAQKPVAQLFDLIAGTSTGGILALGLTLPARDNSSEPKYSASDLVSLYTEDGPEIFSRSLWRRAISVDGLTDQKFTSKGIEDTLKSRFQDTALRDALVPVLVTAYEIERRKPFLFRSLYAQNPPRPDETFDFPMWQVARATSAAPTYFEPFLLKTQGPDESYALVDGGVYANNPGMCAWADARAQYPRRPIVMLSLGTGELTRPILHDEAKDWGLAGWARPVLDVMFDGVSNVVDHQLQQLLGPQYYRFQTTLNEGYDDMDNASRTNLKMLRLQAEELVARSEGKLHELAQMLVGGGRG